MNFVSRFVRFLLGVLFPFFFTLALAVPLFVLLVYRVLRRCQIDNADPQTQMIWPTGKKAIAFILVISEVEMQIHIISIHAHHVLN